MATGTERDGNAIAPGAGSSAALPWPTSLDGDTLASILGIRLKQNRKLRRELNTALSRLGEDWWDSRASTIDDADYGNALRGLLRRPGGYEQFNGAIRRDRNMAGRLPQLPKATRDYVRVRLGRMVSVDGEGLAELAKEHLPEAALIAWANALESRQPDRAIAMALELMPVLRAEFALPPQPAAAGPDALLAPSEGEPASLLAAIATLLPQFAPSHPPSAGIARQLAELAGQLAVALERAETAAEAERKHREKAEAIAARLAALGLPCLLGKALPEVVEGLLRTAAELGLIADLAQAAELAAAEMGRTRHAMMSDYEDGDAQVFSAAASAARASKAAAEALDAAVARLVDGASIVPPAPPLAQSNCSATAARAGEGATAAPDTPKAPEPTEPPAEQSDEPPGDITQEAALATLEPTMEPAPRETPQEATAPTTAQAAPESPATPPIEFGPMDTFALGRRYWVARAAEAHGGEIAGPPQAQAFAAFVHGLALLAGEAESEAEAERAALAMLHRVEPLDEAELALLLPAALAFCHVAHALLPALHGLDAAAQLRLLEEPLRRLANSGLELRAPLLDALRSRESREAELVALRDATRRWLEGARLRTVVYQPATRVWQDWLADTGPLGGPLREMERGTLTLAAAGRAAAHWRDRAAVEDAIAVTDARLRGGTGDVAAIDGNAVDVLYRNAGIAAELFSQSVRQLGGVPPADGKAVHLLAFRKAVEAAVARAGAGGLVGTLLAQLDHALAGVRPAPFEARLMLGAPMVLRPEIALNGVLEPTVPLPSPQVLATLLQAPVSAAESARLRAARGEIAATEAALRLHEAAGTPAQELDELRDGCGEMIERLRIACTARRQALERRLERDRWLDLLQPEPARVVAQRLAACQDGSGWEASEVQALLDAAESLLEDGEAPFMAGLNERRQRLALPANQLAGLDRAIASRDLERAAEHLLHLEGDRPMPAAATQSDLPAAQFVAFLERLASPTDGLLTQRLPTETLLRERIIPAAGMTAPVAIEDARRVLDAWRNAQSRNGFTPDELRPILRFLGFGGVQSLSQIGTAPHFRLVAPPFDQVSDCPLWQFGSGAKGRYEVLSVGPLPQTPERLLHQVEERGISAETALIVLTPRPMSDAFRRGLLTALGPRQRRLVVLDESLMLFLSIQPAQRLPLFWRCTLPWTGLQPYITRAGIPLPPELFVGRLRERQEIESSEGACLVYGGRQLGKTALLREIERRHGAEGERRITFWLDLAALGIEPEDGRPLDTVWQEIGRRLGEGGIKEANLGFPQLSTGVAKWLEEHRDGGRILVLLDEADEFIEADSRAGFAELRRMKGLMDRTEQRFKVVFTGLHNVQRASHHPNTPLAHLGTPVCIGPLHGHAEAAEAWRLATDPFTARGFRFDPPDLPFAILAQANYYPSLIQLICARLIDQLSQAGRVPPGTVTEQDVRQALDSRELRGQLQDRFMLTLRLDLRYHLFALCLARHAVEAPTDPRLIDGFEPAWFAEQALEYWSEGFPGGAPPTQVRILLEEMVGLGVLAETPQGRFVLRSPSLRPLLGDRARLDEALMGFIGRPPPRPDAPGTFRRRLGDDPGDPRRSPLSMDDEGVLLQRDHGVVVVSGLAVAGIGLLESALRRALPASSARILLPPHWDGTLDEPGLRAMLRQFAQQAARGINLIVLGPDADWAPDLPLAASRMLERPERERLIRFIFVADGRAAWQWREIAVQPAATDGLARRPREVALMPLSPDTLRRWIDETGAPGAHDDADRRAMWDASGGFVPALEPLAAPERPHPGRFAGIVLEHLVRNGREPLDDWPVAAHRALQAIVREGLDEFDADLLAESAQIQRASAQRIIGWAEWMGAAAATVPGYYRLNPLIARLLARAAG